MEHKETPVLEVLVGTDPAGMVELDSEIDHVTNQNEVRHMSARYMLTGKDSDGADCHICVENSAWFTDGARYGAHLYHRL